MGGGRGVKEGNGYRGQCGVGARAHEGPCGAQEESYREVRAPPGRRRVESVSEIEF